jgi:hypothetical protein
MQVKKKKMMWPWVTIKDRLVNDLLIAGQHSRSKWRGHTKLSIALNNSGCRNFWVGEGLS